MYERLSLEAFQAGLSWVTILRKRPAFRAAFADFHPDTVAAFGDGGRRAADGATPASCATGPRSGPRSPTPRRPSRCGPRAGCADFVWSFQPADDTRPGPYADVPTTSPESVALSKALRKKGFAFVGPTTMFALMEAIGIVDTHLVGSHRRGSSGVWPQ